jgi:hypothetical protein
MASALVDRFAKLRHIINNVAQVKVYIGVENRCEASVNQILKSRLRNEMLLMQDP